MAARFISEHPISTTRSIGQPGNCHNRKGKNQYKDRPLPDDPQVAAALKVYHQRGINDSEEISRLLLEEHGVVLCGSSVKRRRQKLGLLASRATTSQMSDVDKRRLVVEEMAKDPKGRCGPQVIKQRIFQATGIHLSRSYIREEMRGLDPESYAKRGPRHMKVKRLQRLAREGQTAPTTSTLEQPVRATETQRPLATQSVIQVCDSGPATPPPYHEAENESMGSDTSEVPSIPPLQGVSDFSSERTQRASSLMTKASTLLENAIPTMTALTWILNDSSMLDLEIDQATHELFNRGIESAALLERQLSRVISHGRGMAGREG